MGLDGMRVGGGRCPPLFVGALLLACFLLVCNWWSLSTENLELLRQINEFNEAMRISGDERDQCVTLKESIHKRQKQLEDEVGTLHVRLQEMNDLKKSNDELRESVTICKSELDSLNKLDATKSATLETLRLEKDTISTQLDAKREENKKLNTDLETALAEVEKLKLSINLQPKEKDDKLEESPPVSRGVKLGLGQLEPVDESAVNIAVPGLKGNKYHGVPILPRDRRDVARQIVLPSNSFPKAPTSEPVKDNFADADGKEDGVITADVNASGLENRFDLPEEPFDAKPPVEK